MKTQSVDLKNIVRSKYSEIARLADEKNQCGCDCGCGHDLSPSIFVESYLKLDGYNPDADLGLGCGIPTEFAQISEGDTVLDLGCGAGNDCFVARSIVGESGKVVGIDFTQEMIVKANQNLTKMGYKNIEFVFGDIENMPLSENTVNVVVSNCVLNLVPDKNKAFSEIYRVLKNDGHFCVSDIVYKGIYHQNCKRQRLCTPDTLQVLCKKRTTYKPLKNKVLRILSFTNTGE